MNEPPIEPLFVSHEVWNAAFLPLTDVADNVAVYESEPHPDGVNVSEPEPSAGAL